MEKGIELSNHDIVDRAKTHLLETVSKADPRFSYLPRHLQEVEKWAGKLIAVKDGNDREIVLLAVWLHDIGRVVGRPENDHAVNSEIEARRFLSEIGEKEEVVEKVAHCVRAHRCRDVAPETLEARILAASDSASHMTDTVYIDMASRGDIEEAKAKLERDYRDIGIFPEFRNNLTELYEAWKKLLEVFPLY